MKTELAQAAHRARERKNLSLRAVAKRARVSPQSVHDVEAGCGGWKASVSVLKALGLKKSAIRALVVNDVVRELRLA